MGCQKDEGISVSRVSRVSLKLHSAAAKEHGFIDGFASMSSGTEVASGVFAHLDPGCLHRGSKHRLGMTAVK